MQTPLSVIAEVSRIVTRIVDRLTGDRVEVPLLVSMACVEALKIFGIESRVMYGQVAWIEILTDQTPLWAGCWGENYSFWVATQYGEVVDLNVSVAHRKRSHSNPKLEALYSPPLLWSAEVPGFYRYVPEGVAELELTDPADLKKFSQVIEEVVIHCQKVTVNLKEEDLEFLNEPILCPGRRLLDDSNNSFRHFDRALSVHGLPEAPI